MLLLPRGILPSLRDIVARRRAHAPAAPGGMVRGRAIS